MAEVKKNAYKYCIVPMCQSTTIKNPNKFFFRVPNNTSTRKRWCKVMKCDLIGPKSIKYVCEDHFDVENDTVNLVKHRLAGGTLKLKPNICPYKFDCQKMVKSQEQEGGFNYNFLIEQSDICRCCLSNIGGVDLGQPYGVLTEALNTILLKYFNITLATQSGHSYTICEECATKIENIHKFHEQVKLSQRKYNELWNLYKNETIRRNLDENTDGHVKNDEDIPISKLQSKEKIDALSLQTPKICKQISERKRIILTCGIVLKETTACPFRHIKSWFRCFFCTKDFMELNILREHTNQSHADIDNELKIINRFPRSLQIDISNLECRKCHLNLTDVDSMRRHLSVVHNNVIYTECIVDYKVNSSPYTCHLCQKKFHVFRSLTTHLNEHYANCICDICGKSFLNSKRLKVHKRTHENGSYPCLKCGKVLKTQTSKANHMEMHSKRIIKCHLCEKQMKHYNDRIKHMSEVHNITHNFACPFCSRVYNIKHYLATHIRQTHGNKNKKCTECNMAFITNHSLKKHMVKHSGERPYTCSICSKAYTRKYTLKEHMRDHERVNKLHELTSEN